MTSETEVQGNAAAAEGTGASVASNQGNAASSTGKKNVMSDVIVSKITLNVGAGKSEANLKKGQKLLGMLSPVKPILTKTKKRIPSFGLRPGLAIGVKATVRKGALELVKKFLKARENTLKASSFDKQGNFSFGVAEYIDVEGMEYDPELKIMGFEVAVTLERKGFRVARRKEYPRKVGKSHVVSKEDAIAFAKEVLGVNIE